MKKSIIVAAAAVLVAAHAFAASYWVVLKDGTRYQAKAKPTISNGRAIIQMASGGSLAVDANSIDVAKSEEVTRLGGGEVLGSEPAPTTPPMPSQTPLGSQIHLRKLPNQQQQRNAPPTTAAPAVVPPAVIPNAGGGSISGEVIEKFTRAFENVGIYEHTVTATGPNSLRAELTADNEEKVFNVLSAAAFLTTHNAGVTGANIQMVEIFMKTTTGGSAGRFQMSQADAQALYAGGIPPDRSKLEDYYVRKVLY